MGQGPEAALVKRIVRSVRLEHPEAWVLKAVGNPYQVSGVPDLLLCVEGRFFAFEVKARRPGESLGHARARATAQQVWQIDRIHRAGGIARVVTSAEEVLGLIAHTLRLARAAPSSTLSITEQRQKGSA
jgi:hypothetical protein